METSKRALARNLKRSLIGITLIGVGLAAQGVSAKPNDKAPKKNNPNVNSAVAYTYGVEWGPGCSSFAVTSSMNAANNTKDISNILLVCEADANGNVTWSKWEFDDTPYQFGTALPGNLAPSEGNGCTVPISTAYVKAGSFRDAQKGIDELDAKQFNGHVDLEGKVDCDDGGAATEPEPDPDPQPDPDPEPDTGG